MEQIEGEVRALNQDELKAFREWFLRFDADAWDEQIETDVKSGKLKALAQRALRDHQSGRSTGELEQIQFLLGHQSVETTERYLGCKQRLRAAVNDCIGIEP